MNIVTVAINAVEQDGSNLDDGHLHFEASDLAWLQEANLVAALTPIDLYANGGVSTGASVDLLAMDNAGVSTNWKWVISGELHGVAFPARYLTVNYANGANQNLADLLAASTLVTT